MSLSALNYPPLVAAIGTGALAILPIIEGMEFPFLTLKCANFVTYWINVGAVSVPGRLDGQMQQTTESLVSPSGWAFSIWGPIFLGELALVIAQLFEGSSGSMAPFIKSATVPFVAANIFQSLWCAAFRPKYKGGWTSVSVAALASTAYSLSKVHTASLGLTGWQYLIYGLPTSLHFGWVTAASLVNLNGAVSMQNEVSAKTIAWVGHLSVVAATILGVMVTVNRKAPVYGGVICWALTAVADGMAKRVAATKDDKDQERGGVLGAKFQHRLSQAGALLTAGASIAVMALLASKGDRIRIAP